MKNGDLVMKLSDGFKMFTEFCNSNYNDGCAGCVLNSDEKAYTYCIPKWLELENGLKDYPVNKLQITPINCNGDLVMSLTEGWNVFLEYCNEKYKSPFYCKKCPCYTSNMVIKENCYDMWLDQPYKG